MTERVVKLNKGECIGEATEAEHLDDSEDSQCADAHSELDGSIMPALSNLSRCPFSSFSKHLGTRLIRCFMGRASPVSISCSISEKDPRSNSSLAKTSENPIQNGHQHLY
jgi:hypothetical protein